MTRNTGKPAPLLALLLLPFLLLAAHAMAAVNATVDRTSVTLGDTLLLTLSATADDENLQGVDTSHLAADFEVLSRNMRSSMNVINGVQSHKRELSMEISPRRTGTLTIPPFSLGAGRTQAIRIEVSDTPQVDPGNEVVLFDAEVDSSEVYVQGQLLLTLRIQQSISLERAGISELELPEAFVVPLEQKSYQRRMNGRLWLVQEVRYAIFPEQSGTLVIPAQQFSARESTARRSLFDPGNRGRMVRRTTEPVTIDVLPKPLDYPAGDWLPARSLQIEEEWSQDPENLHVGESVTRTVRIRGEGLQGAQLPPTLFPQQPGLKFYPDQPQIDDREIASGLQGVRRDSVAIVPTGPGTVSLPAIEIPWWDTTTNSLRKAVIPARTLMVAPAAVGATPPPAGTGLPDTVQTMGAAPNPASLLPWQLAALALGLGWIITGFLWWRSLQSSRPTDSLPRERSEGANTRAAYRNLMAACTSGAAAPARGAVIAWADSIADDGRVTTLAEVKALFSDPQLNDALEQLETALYGSGDHSWEGTQLKDAVERLRREWNRSAGKQDDSTEFALYPGS